MTKILSHKPSQRIAINGKAGAPFTPPVVDISPLLLPAAANESEPNSDRPYFDLRSDYHDVQSQLRDSVDSKVAKCVDFINSACADIGLFIVTGHHIYRQLDDVFRTAHAFFGMQDSLKAQVPRVNHYGYVPHQSNAHRDDCDRDSTDKSTARSSLTAEYFDMGLADEVDLDVVSGLGCEGFTAAVRSYQASALRTADVILEALAVALGVPGYFFVRMKEPQCRLRFLHYMPSFLTKPNAPVPILSTAHTDYGLITLLATDGQPGLEVLLDGVWRPIVTKPQTLIVQLGDMLARWTNDCYRSTPHRVMGSAVQDRFTIPFFINPDPTTIIETIPNCITAEQPARYQPVTAGEFLISRIQSNDEPYL